MLNFFFIGFYLTVLTASGSASPTQHHRPSGSFGSCSRGLTFRPNVMCFLVTSCFKIHNKLLKSVSWPQFDFYLHCSGIFSTVYLLQQSFSSQPGLWGMEFGCPYCACMGSVQVLWLPPTVQISYMLFLYVALIVCAFFPPVCLWIVVIYSGCTLLVTHSRPFLHYHITMHIIHILPEFYLWLRTAAVRVILISIFKVGLKIK